MERQAGVGRRANESPLAGLNRVGGSGSKQTPHKRKRDSVVNSANARNGTSICRNDMGGC